MSFHEGQYTDSITEEPYNVEDLKVQVCQSAAGYYVGRLEPSGCPFDRLSSYYDSFEEAERALKEEY